MTSDVKAVLYTPKSSIHPAKAAPVVLSALVPFVSPKRDPLVVVLRLWKLKLFVEAASAPTEIEALLRHEDELLDELRRRLGSVEDDGSRRGLLLGIVPEVDACIQPAHCKHSCPVDRSVSAIV